MALTATVYRLRVALSDVDRGVYEELDLRLARHPSETMEYLLTRVLAYCFCFEEGIEMGGGISNVDEPAVWVREPHGSVKVWIDVGTPTADRMHRASKASEKLVIYTHHDPALLLKEAGKKELHRKAEIEVMAVDKRFLGELAALTDRNARWELTRSDDQIYLKVGDKTLEASLTKLTLDG